MEDECRVTRDPSGTSDDTFDQDTGAYTPPPSDVADVYEGKCLLTTQSNVGRGSGAGGGSFQIVGYRLQVPIASEEIKKGDWVELTSSKLQAEKVGMKFQVDKTEYKTMALTQAVTLTSEEAVEL